MYMNKLRVLKKLDTLFYSVSSVSFYPDHNAQPYLLQCRANNHLKKEFTFDF